MWACRSEKIGHPAHCHRSNKIGRPARCHKSDKIGHPAHCHRSDKIGHSARCHRFTKQFPVLTARRIFWVGSKNMSALLCMIKMSQKYSCGLIIVHLLVELCNETVWKYFCRLSMGEA